MRLVDVSGVPVRVAFGAGVGVTDLSGVLDDDGVIRLLVLRLSEALVSLLGAQPAPGRLRELADLADDFGAICRQRADRLAEGSV